MKYLMLHYSALGTLKGVAERKFGQTLLTISTVSLASTGIGFGALATDEILVLAPASEITFSGNFSYRTAAADENQFNLPSIPMQVLGPIIILDGSATTRSPFTNAAGSGSFTFEFSINGFEINNSGSDFHFVFGNPADPFLSYEFSRTVSATVETSHYPFRDNAMVYLSNVTTGTPNQGYVYTLNGDAMLRYTWALPVMDTVYVWLPTLNIGVDASPPYYYFQAMSLCYSSTAPDSSMGVDVLFYGLPYTNDIETAQNGISIDDLNQAVNAVNEAIETINSKTYIMR